jgi:hypothetical protein
VGIEVITASERTREFEIKVVRSLCLERGKYKGQRAARGKFELNGLASDILHADFDVEELQLLQTTRTN